MTDEQRLQRARFFFDRYLQLLRSYDIAAYDLFADDAVITSARRGIVTLRWNGKQFRELIGPSLEAAREAGRTYELRDVSFAVDGEYVVVCGSFEPTTPGQEGTFVAKIGQNQEGQWRFLEFHDGTPLKDCTTHRPSKRVQHPDGSIEVTLIPDEEQD